MLVFAEEMTSRARSCGHVTWRTTTVTWLILVCHYWPFPVDPSIDRSIDWIDMSVISAVHCWRLDLDNKTTGWQFWWWLRL